MADRAKTVTDVALILAQKITDKVPLLETAGKLTPAGWRFECPKSGPLPDGQLIGECETVGVSSAGLALETLMSSSAICSQRSTGMLPNAATTSGSN